VLGELVDTGGHYVDIGAVLKLVESEKEDG
jgi:hypothetical protein